MFIEFIANVSHFAHRMRKKGKVPKTCISLNNTVVRIGLNIIHATLECLVQKSS